jgi:DNA-binding beta-propeller fold protein YncE
VVAVANLAGDADYVRYVGFDHEVWVTQPHHKQIEIFSFSGGDRPKLRASASIPVHEGPESLVIDHRRGNAYTNAGTMAVAIDLGSHRIVATWPNGCEKSRGDALDDQKGFLFVSCSEGKAVVFDLNQGHKEISNLTTGPGPDVISYNPKLSHLYVTSSQNAVLSIIKVSGQGELSLLGQAQTDKRTHCVVSDDQNNIWVCDPSHGQLLRFKDTL